MEPALSLEEERKAGRVNVHVVWWLFERENAAGEEVTWGIPLAIHRTRAEAARAAASDDPPGPEADPAGRRSAHGPVNLLALHRAGFADTAALRSVLGRRGSVRLPPRVRYHPSAYDALLRDRPLSRKEARRAAELSVWIVHYEDRFHSGDARRGWPVAVCLSEAEADGEVRRRGPVGSGWDGCSRLGPVPLARPEEAAPEVGAGTVREVLRRATGGRAGPVPVR